MINRGKLWKPRIVERIPPSVLEEILQKLRFWFDEDKKIVSSRMLGMFAKSESSYGIVTILFFCSFFFLLWYMASIVLMLFGGLLWAIFLNKSTKQVQRFVHWPYPITLTIIFIGIIAIFTLIGLITAPKVAVQISDFSLQINRSWQELYTYIGQFDDDWMRFTASFHWSEQLQKLPQVLRSATSWFTAFGGGLFTGFIVLYVGTLVAYNPEPYRNGVLMLFPKDKQKQIRVTLDELKDSLWRWLLGRFSSMLVVGILTWIGLIILDMPLPFLLAFIAGCLSFIPNIGIMIATSLALLIAFPMGNMVMLWVIALYIIIQIIEGNFITPFIEQHLMKLPAGLIIVSQIVFAYLFGFLGIMFATPLLVALIVITKKLYVENVLS